MLDNLKPFIISSEDVEIFFLFFSQTKQCGHLFDKDNVALLEVIVFIMDEKQVAMKTALSHQIVLEEGMVKVKNLLNEGRDYV